VFLLKIFSQNIILKSNFISSTNISGSGFSLKNIFRSAFYGIGFLFPDFLKKNQISPFPIKTFLAQEFLRKNISNKFLAQEFLRKKYFMLRFLAKNISNILLVQEFPRKKYFRFCVLSSKNISCSGFPQKKIFQILHFLA